MRRGKSDYTIPIIDPTHQQALFTDAERVHWVDWREKSRHSYLAVTTPQAVAWLGEADGTAVANRDGLFQIRYVDHSRVLQRGDPPQEEIAQREFLETQLLFNDQFGPDWSALDVSRDGQFALWSRGTVDTNDVTGVDLLLLKKAGSKFIVHKRIVNDAFAKSVTFSPDSTMFAIEFDDGSGELRTRTAVDDWARSRRWKFAKGNPILNSTMAFSGPLAATAQSWLWRKVGEFSYTIQRDETKTGRWLRLVVQR